MVTIENAQSSSSGWGGAPKACSFSPATEASMPAT